MTNYAAWKAFDGKTNAATESNTSIFTIYVKINRKIKLSSFDLTTYTNNNYLPYAMYIFATNDGTHPTYDSSQQRYYTNLQRTAGATITYNTGISDYYDDYLFYFLTTLGTAYTQIAELKLYGSYLDTPPDYVNAWAAPNEHKWVIKY